MTNYLYMYVFGILALAYTSQFHKNLLKIDLKGLKKFLLALSGITLMRIAMLNLFPAEFQNVAANLINISWWQCILAGYEEVMFTLPAVLVIAYTDNKYLKYLLTGLIAGVFALGHAYQGMYGVIVTFYYMFAIAPKYLKKYGLYTMIVAHILFDLSGWFILSYFDKLMW